MEDVKFRSDYLLKAGLLFDTDSKTQTQVETKRAKIQTRLGHGQDRELGLLDLQGKKTFDNQRGLPGPTTRSSRLKIPTGKKLNFNPNSKISNWNPEYMRIKKEEEAERIRLNKVI